MPSSQVVTLLAPIHTECDDLRPPHFFEGTGQRVELRVEPGKTVTYRNLFYKNQVRVNVRGYWRQGYAEPLWVMTNLSAEQGGQIYFARMKIEESFRDLKSLLHMTKVMNQQQAKMEQVVAWVLLAFTIGLLVGKELRDVLYGPPPTAVGPARRNGRMPAPFQKPGQKWKLYSGLFILLRQKIDLSLAASQLVFEGICESWKFWGTSLFRRDVHAQVS